MAEPKAQTSLGQLFVDIGVNGLGKTLKGLNSISASFLLGKNAANQFVQTLAQPFKAAGNTAVQIGKMSNALATTSTEYQRLAMYLKSYNLSDELLGDVRTLEQKLYDISQGFSNIPGSMAIAMQQAGLNIMDYNGTFESTMKLFDDLQAATKNMSKEKRNFILRQMGISSDWGYLWDKGGRAGDYITISKEAIKENEELAEKIEELKNSTNNLKDELLSKIAPSLTKVAGSLIEFEKTFIQNDGVEVTTNTVKGAFNAYKDLSPFVKFFPLNGIYGMFTGGQAGYDQLFQKEKSNKTDLPMPPKELPEGMETGGASGIGVMGELPSLTPDIIEENAELPANISELTQNITNNISHNITINGNNAHEIAGAIAGISAQDIQFAQFQATNLAGL